MHFDLEEGVKLIWSRGHTSLGEGWIMISRRGSTSSGVGGSHTIAGGSRRGVF